MPHETKARIVLPVILAGWCMTAVPSQAADPIRVGVKVLGESPIAEPLRSCLGSRLSHHPGYVLVDRLPTNEVDVVTNVDANDTVNRSGVSFAVAYVEHANAIALTKALSGGGQPTTNPQVRDATLALFSSGGSLQRLNVGHVGRMNAEAVPAACGRIAEEFFREFPVGR